MYKITFDLAISKINKKASLFTYSRIAGNEVICDKLDSAHMHTCWYGNRVALNLSLQQMQLLNLAFQLMLPDSK